MPTQPISNAVPFRRPIAPSRLTHSRLSMWRAVVLVFALILMSMLSLQHSMLLERKEFFVKDETLKLRKNPWPTAAHPVAEKSGSLSETRFELGVIVLTEAQSLGSDANSPQVDIIAPSESVPHDYGSDDGEVEKLVKTNAQPTTRKPASDLLATKTQFMRDLWKASQQKQQESRGIVLPLFNGIAPLGMSLIMELRAMGVDLPIEIPHCGDLDQKFRRMIYKRHPLVQIHNVCKAAVEAKTETGKPLFCNNLRHCHQKFRGFDIKIISVVFSRFQEVMLMDADTVYFRSPMALWESEQYKTTGTFFFHDRIGQERTILTKVMRNSTPPITLLEDFLSRFDIDPFQLVPTLNRTIASSGPAAEARAKATVVPLSFQPSDVLLTSHSWNRRSGHEVDSSLLLWDKTRQPRATAILASFVSIMSSKHPPGYGDKELFFLACELAETNYAFSNIGVGSIGVTYRIYKERNGQKTPVVCGDALQFLPTGLGSRDAEGKTITDSALPLYFNGDSALAMKPGERQILRTQSRSADFYNGSNRERGFPLACLMDMKIMRSTPEELKRLSRRQRLHEIVLKWLEQLEKTDVPHVKMQSRGNATTSDRTGAQEPAETP